MKFFKITLLTIVCGLFFMGSKCGDPTEHEICLGFLTSEDCDTQEQLVDEDQNGLCEWKPGKEAKCNTVMNTMLQASDGAIADVNLKDYCNGMADKDDCVKAGCVFNNALVVGSKTCFPPECSFNTSGTNETETKVCGLSPLKDRGIATSIKDERDDTVAAKFCTEVPGVKGMCVHVSDMDN